VYAKYPGGHLLIIHRWIDGPADYASYVDHRRTAVSYVVNPRSEASVPAAAAAVVMVGDTADLGQVRAAIAGPVGRLGRPQAVIALSEGDLAVAAVLRAEYGCPGRRAADLHRFLDKLAMLDAARAAGADVPPYRLVRSAVQLSRFAETAGWPLVVKPLNGREPAGARLVTSEADALDVDWPGPMLAQRHVALPVYHADGYYDGQDVAPWQLARYAHVPGHSAHGPVAFSSGEPAGEVVVDDPAQLAAAGEYLRTLIPRLSARPWTFHLEFFLGQRDGRWHPVFLEAGCRPGGRETPFSWREVYDVDLLRLEFALQRGFTPAPPRMSNARRLAGSSLAR
jgi:hypothetical protein